MTDISVHKRPVSPKVNNNIAPIRKIKHIRLVKFDLNSPKMAEAIRNLGLVDEDMNTKLRRENFPHEDTRVTEL
jgi:hypothetical protein